MLIHSTLANTKFFVSLYTGLVSLAAVAQDGAPRHLDGAADLHGDASKLKGHDGATSPGPCSLSNNPYLREHTSGLGVSLSLLKDSVSRRFE